MGFPLVQVKNVNTNSPNLENCDKNNLNKVCHEPSACYVIVFRSCDYGLERLVLCRSDELLC